MLVGLVVTAALGLMMVGALNPISIAFAVLFVGIGVDFGIQFSVRYRAERYEVDDLAGALANAARNVGAPLTLAAAATAAGFLSFLPTAYGGVSELGQIAGVGMIIAYRHQHHAAAGAADGAQSAGREGAARLSQWLAPVDRFTGAPPHSDHRRHRWRSCSAACRCSIILQFDFNPINLRNPKVESIATYLDLRRDPATGASAIDVLAPSLATWRADRSERLAKVPEVVARRDAWRPSCRTDQERKLALIRKAARGSSLRRLPSRMTAAPPTDAENVAALDRAVRSPDQAAGQADRARRRRGQAPGRRPGASSPRPTRPCAPRPRSAFVAAAQDRARRDLQELLQAGAGHRGKLPPELAKDWIQPDGRSRVQVYAEGRSERQRDRCASSRAPCWRSSPTRVRRRRSRSWKSGHTIVHGLHPGRRLGADLDRDPAVDRAAALRRRAADARAAAARRRASRSKSAC